jgi:hypothetical protein
VEPHRLAEARSIALHEEVARRLRADSALLEAARARVDGWLASGAVHPRYALAWRDLLSSSLDEVCAAIVDPGERARALRQSTPFAGVVDPRTRWRIWRAVRASAS